jgi:hypothetical protein
MLQLLMVQAPDQLGDECALNSQELELTMSRDPWPLF